MSNRSKGQRTVRKCLEELTLLGWIPEAVEKAGRYGGKDLFGVWDVIGISPAAAERGLNFSVCFVQCKTNKQGTAWKEPYTRWVRENWIPHVAFELWNWIDRKGFEVTSIGQHGITHTSTRFNSTKPSSFRNRTTTKSAY